MSLGSQLLGGLSGRIDGAQGLRGGVGNTDPDCWDSAPRTQREERAPALLCRRGGVGIVRQTEKVVKSQEKG